jgi:hypothetical protein
MEKIAWKFCYQNSPTNKIAWKFSLYLSVKKNSLCHPFHRNLAKTLWSTKKNTSREKKSLHFFYINNKNIGQNVFKLKKKTLREKKSFHFFLKKSQKKLRNAYIIFKLFKIKSPYMSAKNI